MAGNRTERHEAHWIEWLTGLVSAALVLAIVAWIAYEAIRREDTPPDLTITVLDTRRTGSGHRVTFEIRNAAPTSAAAVTVVGEIRGGDSVLDRAEVIFDYVPAESKAKGALIFEDDPAAGMLVIRPTGFTDP
ncbi:TIGR02588 family protein [Rhizobium sp. TRM95111]|uniref:TIGR02588 family protein n=1 Tax=Rhizobium alarense TaxID=2846851 RepID=UPI001F358B20|nr:TIGR02588 family protein [Rhizobium alarense]MCF3642150.1 TIGR02588 family protein [Rhizobium alarense]